MKLLYKGKTKDVFFYNSKNLCFYYKDTILGFNNSFDPGGNAVIGSYPYKGIYNVALLEKTFQLLLQNNIQTHFVKKKSNREVIYKKAKKIPIEFICRNFACGSYLKRFKCKKFKKLNKCIELCLKDDAKNDPFIDEQFIYQNLCLSKKNLSFINSIIKKINKILTSYFKKYNLTLIDFKIEFGFFNKKIIVIDELSFDTMRLSYNNKVYSYKSYKSILKKLNLL